MPAISLTSMNRHRRVGLAAGAALATAGALAGAAVSTSASASTATPYPSVQQLTPKKAIFLSAKKAPGPVETSTHRQFTPPGIQKSYNLPALYDEGLTGAGRTIAIVDSFGYPQAAADLKQFSNDYGLPLMCGMPDVTCKAGMPRFSELKLGNRQVKAPPPNNKSPEQQASNAWSVEVALDVQYAHTVAPGANILLVTTPVAETLGVQGLPNMMNVEQYVVDHHLADVVSQSFGAAEGSFASTQSLLNLRHAFISGTAAGITFVAASGDNGTVGIKKEPVSTGGTVLPTPEVGWPASDPLVTAVGGTNLCTDVFTGEVNSTPGPADCQQNPGQRETGWNGSGGGFSHVFARPSYQDSLPAGSTPIPADSRGVPDISMNASCGTYVVVLDTAPGFGGYFGVCGTSEASPMFAGIVAIADQAAGHSLGDLGPALYRLGTTDYSAIYDVTSGNNTQAGSGIPGYAAGTGWDPVTGLGTPGDAHAFVHALVH
jgi:subtilase family serine protease